MASTASPIARYDLHNHTYWSYDALAKPATYFRRAAELGMTCLAITEHHHVDSLPEVLALAAGYPGLRVIPSAELTVTTSLGAVDLLCYGLPADPTDLSPDNLAAWQRVRAQYYQWQRDYGAAVCRGLQALGLDYTDTHRIDLLRSYRPAKTIDVQGFTHVRNGTQSDYFLQRGFIKSADEYWPLLFRAAAAVPTSDYPPVADVVPAVKATGALVAIAHPYGDYFQGADRQRMDHLRQECQLDGIECAHPAIPPDFTPIYRRYCLDHDLLSTAGTDCHTDAAIQSSLARHGGDDAWLDELLARLDHR